MENQKRKIWFDPKDRKLKRHKLIFHCPLFNTTLSGCNLSCNPCTALKYRKENTTVVNANQEEFDVYIGRGTKWGNKFHIGVDGTREEVIEKYKIWFLENPQLHNIAIIELQGKTLGCICKPLPCHGDVLIDFIEGRIDYGHSVRNSANNTNA